LVRLTSPQANLRQAWETATARPLADGNLRFEAIAPVNPEPGDGHVLTLVGPDQRTLPIPTPPALLQTTPPPAAPEISAFVEQIALSPLRDQLHSDLLSSFAVLLLIEGTQPGPTTTARRTVEEAIQAFTPLLRSLPKPVDVPPRLVTLSPDRLPSERILVWSLGLNPEPAAEPRLAFLYGRGRQIGAVLEGPLITRTAIGERLTLIGQDCECDLDRAWLQGQVFPARWDTTRQTAAARTLGFDPENPLVRSEVSRIVLRGPLPGQARRPMAKTGFDSLALGYWEEVIEDPAEAPAEPDPASPPATPPVQPREAVATAATAATAAAPPPAPEAERGPASRLPWTLLLLATTSSIGAGLVLLLRHLRNR
jgi:hypothetical protein